MHGYTQACGDPLHYYTKVRLSHSRVGVCKLVHVEVMLIFFANMKRCTTSKQTEICIRLGKMLTSVLRIPAGFRYPQDSPLVGFWKYCFKRGAKSVTDGDPLIFGVKVHYEVGESIELGITENIVYVFPIRLRYCKGFWIQVLEIADVDIDK